jgi:hypothetical protein
MVVHFTITSFVVGVGCEKKITLSLVYREMKIVSTKQFWWRFNHLKRNGGEITVTDKTPEMDIKEFNRIELLVNKRVRWEIGSEGMAIWNACGVKDIPTLAKAYGIK